MFGFARPTPDQSDWSGESLLGCLIIVARHREIHLTVEQLIHDNVLPTADISVADLQRCASNSGLNSTLLHLKVPDLANLKKVLPCILRMQGGGSLVLLRRDEAPEGVRFILQDPNAADGDHLVLDPVRLEAAWTGDVLLLKRDYDITDQDQPFSLSLISALIFKERWIVRDLSICAVILGMLALAPIMFFRLLIDKVLYYQALSTFFVLSIAMVVLIGFEAIFSYIRNLLVLHLTTRIDVKLNNYLFDKILSLPMDFFEKTQVGKITHDLHQLTRIRTFLAGQLFGTVLDSTTLLFFLPVMFFFSPLLTFVILGICALIVLWLLAMLPVFRRKTSVLERAEAQRGAFLVQSIQGIRTVKSLALDARQRRLYDVHIANVAKLRFAAGMTGNLMQAVVKPLERLAVSGSIGLGVYFAMSTKDPVYVGALLAFMMLARRVVSPLVQMARMVDQYGDARHAIQVLGGLANQPKEEGRTGHGVKTPLQGEVQFSQVTFSYKGSVSPALKGVSFEAPTGTTLGIMGKSGSGKTTITRLLQRLHSDYGGLIKIDGIDVREYDLDHLRSSLGVVLQENFLFSGTIRENITAAKADATFDEVVRAARLAGAEEFIDKLPRGYETFIFEGSPNLSGGQRQRLAIARALITNPRILILDEATSALDADSEAIVNANISRIAHGRTMIIISHRLSSLVRADAILVLDHGEVVDVGKHEELLERCDIYGELWHLQNGHVAPTPVRARNPRLVS